MGSGSHFIGRVGQEQTANLSGARLRVMDEARGEPSAGVAHGDSLEPDNAERVAVGLVLLATMLGAAVRLASAMQRDFPINDGGLFYSMVGDLLAGRGVPPLHASYNGGDLPFAYPPLALYLTYALATVTGWSVLDLVRVLPPVVSVLTVPAVYLLVRRLTPSALEAGLSTVSFGLLPIGFEWFTMGGGLTRAPGYLFAVLALAMFVDALHTGRWWAAAGAGVCGGLAALSHPGTAAFVAISGVVLLLGRNRGRCGLRTAAISAAIAGAIIAPWVVYVVSRYSPSTLLAAYQTGSGTWSGVLQLLKFTFTDEPALPILGSLGLVGCLVAVAERRWLVPTWLAATFVLLSRSPGVYAAIPLSVLIGRALTVVLSRGLGGVPALYRGRWQVVVAGVIFGYAFVAAWGIQESLAARTTLSQMDRATLSWLDSQSAPGDAVLVVANRTVWDDSASEWLPALTHLRSPLTSQGYEWLPGGVYEARLRAYGGAQRCVDADASCLDALAASNGIRFRYVYMPTSCCAALRQSLSGSDRYRRVYDGASVTIFESIPSAERG